MKCLSKRPIQGPSEPGYLERKAMIIIEIPENSNCQSMDMRVFHDLERSRVVEQVCLEREPGRPEWFEVVGWTERGEACIAGAQKIDDSGEGVAFLIHGGTAGLRLRFAGSQESWSEASAEQWGEPILIVADSKDFILAARVET